MRLLIFWTVGTAFLASGAHAQLLWKEPAAAGASLWPLGPGRDDNAPKPPFRFGKESVDGTNPKVDVSDATGRTWIVKFGSEVHSDTFAALLVSAVGYAAAPTYFVSSGVIEGAHGLKRTKPFIRKDGAFHDARFKLAQKHKQEWSWVQNPFQGSRELGGLKVMIMLLSNWDTKDSRDGQGSNNTIFEPPKSDGRPEWFAVTDWGASMGKSGGFFARARWDWRGYVAQTRDFAKLQPNGRIQWGFRGKHGEDIVAGVTAQDVRWLLPHLTGITDDQLKAGLLASGALPTAAEQFTWAIRQRIRALESIAKASETQGVSK